MKLDQPRVLYSLVHHPNTPANNIEAVTVQLERTEHHVSIIFMVDGDLSALVLPPEAKPYRADGLWRTTCFELFVQNGGTSYVELNFSPSREWAAYAFAGYRAGMRPLGIGEMPLLNAPPAIWTEDEADGLRCFALGTSVEVSAGEPSIALSSVIEEADGTKSYWALAHSPGAPDFHHPACFAARLPAPGRA